MLYGPELGSAGPESSFAWPKPSFDWPESALDDPIYVTKGRTYEGGREELEDVLGEENRLSRLPKNILSVSLFVARDGLGRELEDLEEEKVGMESSGGDSSWGPDG